MTRDSTTALLLIAATACSASTNKLVSPEPHYAQIAARVARRLPREHLTHAPLDDMIAARTWTNYLAALDYDRVYFMRSDIERFLHQRGELDNQLAEGDVSFAYDVFNLFKKRVLSRQAYVEGLLDGAFNLEQDEDYVWRRKDLPWVADEDEWNDVWRRRTKNEYVREMVARTLAKTTRREVSSTNEPPAVADAPPVAEPPSVPEAILNRHRQAVTIFNDSDSEWVLQKYLSAFAHAYDPHSDYMSPSTVEDFNIEMRLSLVGIGALLRPEDGTAKIVRLIPGGPAARDAREHRLRPGDKIIAVAQGDGEPVDIRHWPLYKAVRIIRGEEGTTVVLTVIPASDPTGVTTKEVDLVRDQVKLEEQAAQLRTEEVRPGGSEQEPVTLGVISLPTFYANMKVTSRRNPAYRSAAQDVEKLLRKAGEDGVQGVLLDLRNNGGGSLLEAIRMTGLFIRTGPTVQVRESGGITVLPDRNPAVSYAGPLVVLVNRLSASASEILAGALQDYGRAIIVGDSKTHGKGTVQAIRPLGFDDRLGSIKTTSSIFYRITGNSTQLKGVIPDIVISSPYDYMELGEDHLPNPLPWSSVEPTLYATVADLGPVVEHLTERSEARRQNGERFSAYRKFLHRVRAANETTRLPLQLEKRLAMAKVERELSELQRSLAANGRESPEEENPRQNDLVLDEALRVLADLAALQGREATAADMPANDPADLSNLLEGWIKQRM